MTAALADEMREAIERALVEGESQYGIARRLHVSPGTVHKISAALVEAGRIEPRDRSWTKNATKARLAEMAARRSALAEAMLEKAERLVLSLDEPHTAFNFGGKDNTYAEQAMPAPDAKTAQTIATTAAILLDKHVALLRFDNGGDGDEVVGLLGDLVGALRAQHGDGSDHRKAATDGDPEASGTDT